MCTTQARSGSSPPYITQQIPREHKHRHVISHVPKRIIFHSFKCLSMVNLVTHNRQLVLVAELQYILHVLQTKNCAHGIGGVDHK